MASADHIDWDDLRYFLRALEAKSLAGAARSLGVEHSTVGRRLSALERSLGASLVLRGPHGLQLTALGEKLAPLVHDMGRAAIGFVRTVIRQNAGLISGARPSR
jgi:DNA-binding transcriptional LysR family regulator